MKLDRHSYAEPEKVRLTHLSLSLAASFEKRMLSGTARLTVERLDPAAPLILDTRALHIESVRTNAGNLSFSLEKEDPILGSALHIALPPNVKSLEIRYSTSPAASGLQWLNAEQTAGKTHPFLFSQSQSIHARS